MMSRSQSRFLFLSGLIFFAVGCTHPIEIEGSGDIVSSSGERNCTLELFQAGECNFSIVDEYIESYVAVPRAGNEFSNWRGCGNETSNTCSFAVPAAGVKQNWGKTMPPTVAVFVPVETEVQTSNVEFNVSTVRAASYTVNFENIATGQTVTRPVGVVGTDTTYFQTRSLTAQDVPHGSYNVSMAGVGGAQPNAFGTLCVSSEGDARLQLDVEADVSDVVFRCGTNPEALGSGVLGTCIANKAATDDEINFVEEIGRLLDCPGTLEERNKDFEQRFRECNILREDLKSGVIDQSSTRYRRLNPEVIQLIARSENILDVRITDHKLLDSQVRNLDILSAMPNLQFLRLDNNCIMQNATIEYLVENIPGTFADDNPNADPFYLEFRLVNEGLDAGTFGQLDVTDLGTNESVMLSEANTEASIFTGSLLSIEVDTSNLGAGISCDVFDLENFTNGPDMHQIERSSQVFEFGGEFQDSAVGNELFSVVIEIHCSPI
ncbi:MAG: hypothetical protein AB8B86_19120 [Pseudomonadales bacterium]